MDDKFRSTDFRIAIYPGPIHIIHRTIIYCVIIALMRQSRLERQRGFPCQIIKAAWTCPILSTLEQDFHRHNKSIMCMKLICFILGFGLWLRAVPVSGQANQVESSRGVLQHDPASPMDDKTNSTAPSHEKLTEEDSSWRIFSETWLEDQRAFLGGNINEFSRIM